MAMDFLNEENKDNLVIRDLQKLGKVFYHENDSFKFALKHQLREKAADRRQIDFKKLFSLKWVWVTAPATLLLFVMLAEAAEYAGLEIPPYHYFKTKTLPAVSQKVKQTATTVAKKMAEIAVGPAVKKQVEKNTETASSTTQSNPLIAFEPLTSQEKQQYIQEIKAKLTEKQTLTDLQATYSAQQPADFQPQKPQKLAYDTNAPYQNDQETPQPTQKQIVKDKIINQEEKTSAIDSTSSSAKPPHAKDIINDQKEFPEKNSAENLTTPQKSSPEEAKPDLDTQQKEEPNYQLPVQSQPKDEPARDINISKVQPTPPITTIKEAETLSMTETMVYNESEVVCQNNREMIIGAKNIQEATGKINNILYGLGIIITDKKSDNSENSITITASLDQYNKLIQTVKNAVLDLEEKIIAKQDDCKEISINIHIRKKPSLLEKWFLSPPDKSLK